MKISSIFEARITLGCLLHAGKTSITTTQKAKPLCEDVHSTPPPTKTADNHYHTPFDDEELLDYGEGEEDDIT